MCFLSVLLEAPDAVLIERSQGKRIDPVTGGKMTWRWRTLEMYSRVPDSTKGRGVKVIQRDIPFL